MHIKKFLHAYDPHQIESDEDMDLFLKWYIEEEINWKGIGQKYHLLFDYLVEAISWTRPFEELIKAIPMEPSKAKIILVFYNYYKPIKSCSEILKEFTNLEVAIVDKYTIIYPQGNVKENITQYFSLVKRIWEVDMFVFLEYDDSVINTQWHSHCKKPSVEKMITMSKSFLLYQADFLLAIGKQKENGDWGSKIHDYIVSD